MPTGSERTFGIVEMRLNDSWSVAEFARMLASLDSSYRSFLAIDAFLEDDFPGADSTSERNDLGKLL
jgi:hypothetical protein